jgi:FtsP/CotA-like multicopper oxidase with cupredoxin domain/plastocyanin
MADPTPSSSRPSSSATVLSSVLAVLLGTVGVVALGVVLARDDDASAGGTAGGDHAGMASVSLTEFAIDPEALTVEAGGMVHVSNDGTIEHNLAIQGEDIRTENLGAGDTGELQLGDLAPGDYELLCELPGHADSGMRGTLTVTAAGSGTGGSATGGAGGDGGSGHDMDYQAMTDAMLASMAAFPAATEGVGNQVLEPTEVLGDGTKVFDLTMELGDWEVSPGNVVEAWTFNGMVPAPMIRIQVGDRIQLRVQNDLPIATDVHLHGLNVENRFDGVAPITQDLIEPGESFTYEYVADEQAVAMYHPHAHGHMLLPDGMFGAIIVGDIALPRGQTVGLEQIPADLQVSQEIPMVLNDSGVIGYSLNGKSFPATQPYVAATGDWVLIHYFNEGTQIHPMHLHQFDQIVVAKDGYPIDAPYTVDTLNVAPGERYSVLVNLDRAGTWVWHCHILNHVESEDGMFGMVTAFVVE